MIYRQLVLAPLVLVLLCLSCDRDPVSPPSGAPTTYYLRDNEELSLEPGPSDSWIYITAYIYPSGYTSTSWRTYLEWNITDSKYGCDLIFWSQSDARVRIEFVIDNEGTESVLATEDFDIPFLSPTTGIQIERDIRGDNAIEGTNPQSGKSGDLIVTLTHISGADPVEIYFDGGSGFLGNTSITVHHDR